MEPEGFCRGCLVKYDDPSELHQYSEKNRRLYVYSTGLQVKRNDMFTFQLCKGCYTNMKLSCRFKKQCRVTDKKFRQYSALKESGTNVDFCLFLKTNDDAFGFRLPLSGSSTPMYQKTRDDDNDSTCTSIRNFMTEILPADEIADTEARIIKEVIEEETDVLDDSLDSVWLQDDVSVDDCRLDFSFSPFSTPKTTNEERFETPQKLANDLEINNIKETEYKKSDVIIEIVHLTKNDSDMNEVLINNQNINDIQIQDGFFDLNDQNKDDITTLIQKEEEAILGLKGFYVENKSICNNTIDEPQTDLTIDNNLEQALKENRTEYTLEELLNTPRNHSCESGASTPTINDILFGEKLNFGTNESLRTQIERFDNVDGDIEFFEEFFQDNSPDFNTDNITEGDSLKPTEIDPDEKHNKKDFVCYTCNKQFKNLAALKRHAIQLHKDKKWIQIVNEPKIYLCPECGVTTKGYTNFYYHKKVHHAPKTYKCKYCDIEFKSKEEIQEHNKNTFHVKKTPNTSNTAPNTYKCGYCDIVYETNEEFEEHTNTFHETLTPIANKIPDGKKLTCDICGASFARKQNLSLHMKRHTFDFYYKCKECHLAFPRNSDLNTHMVRHTGLKEFMCNKCNKFFSRKPNLQRHIKMRHDETAKKFICSICDSVFKRIQQLRRHQQGSVNCLRKKNKAKDSNIVVHNLVSWPNGLGEFN